MHKRFLLLMMPALFLAGGVLAQETDAAKERRVVTVLSPDSQKIVEIDEQGLIVVNGKSIAMPRVHQFLLDSLFSFDIIEEVLSRGRESVEAAAEKVREFAEEEVEIRRLESEARRLASKVRTAEGSERQRLERELSEYLAHVFDQRQALRNQRIERLEAELQREREAVHLREMRREDLIQRRKQELLKEREEIDW